MREAGYHIRDTDVKISRLETGEGLFTGGTSRTCDLLRGVSTAGARQVLDLVARQTAGMAGKGLRRVLPSGSRLQSAGSAASVVAQLRRSIRKRHVQCPEYSEACSLEPGGDRLGAEAAAIDLSQAQGRPRWRRTSANPWVGARRGRALRRHRSARGW